MKDLLHNPAYLTATMGYAMSTFTIGGISAWIPSFLQREAGMSGTHAGFVVGAITAATGIAGTALGGWWAQRWLRRDHRALYWVCAAGPAICVPFALLCFFGPRATMLPALAMAELSLFLGSGPVNAAIVNSVSAKVRATALAGQLFLIHLFGDVPSPRIIGFVSDRSNLRWGLGVTVLALVASSPRFSSTAHASLRKTATRTQPPPPELACQTQGEARCAYTSFRWSGSCSTAAKEGALHGQKNHAQIGSCDGFRGSRCDVRWLSFRIGTDRVHLRATN